ncbi:MAG: WYL domain-containing protein [Alphaproteobacteria bacterium]
MAQKKKEQRWNVEKRLEFIDFRLFWEGQINRADIMEQFGVSVPQASNDLSKYQDIAPKNLAYDHKVKRYFPSDSFKPAFIKPDVDSYFRQLRDDMLALKPNPETWLSFQPEHDIVKMPKRNIAPQILKAVTESIKTQKPLEIYYQSMSREEPLWRSIAPHAFAFDGMRWHIRAFCYKGQTFKDFLLSRIQKAGEFAEEEWPKESDKTWNTFFTLILKPHPDLSESQAKAVALDYDMKDGKLELEIRLALLYYYLRRLGLQDCDGTKGNPREQHVVISNKAETKKALEKAQGFGGSNEIH